MKRLRCALYTRKSSEEGLEQDFNSLDARREACAAYVKSQASEGWVALPERYDDGGVSGGTLDRPALQRLLKDIEAGSVDVVVVYKVDRLTRSLLDFSRLVEIFDKAGIFFVSITQSFNTTTSMGRLTLNMLLSFAQFEREVTAERIRDKIAASKAKGMWMGGTPPLGYRPYGRTLAIVEDEAALVQDIFRRYLALGNVRLVAEQLAADRIRAPVRVRLNGATFGGCAFSRGQIYKILSNRMYIGEIEHRGSIHQGQHSGIIDRATWDAVQANLAANLQGHRQERDAGESLLSGLVRDDSGEALVVSHTRKGRVRYRYYVSRALQHGGGGPVAKPIRIPAREIEAAVVARIAAALDDPVAMLDRPDQSGAALEPGDWHGLDVRAGRLAEAVRRRDPVQIRQLVMHVVVHKRQIAITLSSVALAQALGLNTAGWPEHIELVSRVRLTRTGMALRLVYPGGKPVTGNEPDAGLIKLLGQARVWWAALADGTTNITALAESEGANDSWISRVLRLNFLAPQLVEGILAGDPCATRAGLMFRNRGVPVSWEDQLAAARS